MKCRLLLSCATVALALATTPHLAAAATDVADAEATIHTDFTGLWVVSNRTLRGNLDEDFNRMEPADYLTEKGLAATANVRPAYDPSAMCLPSMPRHLGGPYPIEIVQNVGRVVELFEWDNVFRIIYTDGRAHPDTDVDQRFMGHAVGRWEGGTLVVDTANFNGKAWLEGSGIPMAQDYRLTEWMSLMEDGQTLQVIMKIEDDVYLKRPIWRKYVFNLKNDWAIKEYFCTEGNRDNVFMQKDGLPGSLEEDDVLPAK